MRKIKTAVIGTGFMGRVHTEAIRRLGNVEVAAVAAENDEFAAAFAAQTGVDRVVTDYNQILQDPSIEAVHICTPNALHYPDREGGDGGRQARALREAAGDVRRPKRGNWSRSRPQKNLANCVNHNLRYYPVMQQIRAMIENGELGEILVVQGTYSQDWLLYDTDLNWRIDAQRQRPAARDGRYRLALDGHDPARHRAADHRTVRRHADLPQDAQTAEGGGGDVRRQDAEARRTMRRSRSIPTTTARCCSIWATRARGAFTVSQVSAGLQEPLPDSRSSERRPA